MIPQGSWAVERLVLKHSEPHQAYRMNSGICINDLINSSSFFIFLVFLFSFPFLFVYMQALHFYSRQEDTAINDTDIQLMGAYDMYY